MGRGSTGDGNELATGDHMTREEFHRIYAATDDAFRAELIGGIVYVPSPLKRRHGVHHLLLGALFAAYAARTPGVEAGANATRLLRGDAEPHGRAVASLHAPGPRGLSGGERTEEHTSELQPHAHHRIRLLL